MAHFCTICTWVVKTAVFYRFLGVLYHIDDKKTVLFMKTRKINSSTKCEIGVMLSPDTENVSVYKNLTKTKKTSERRVKE